VESGSCFAVIGFVSLAWDINEDTLLFALRTRLKAADWDEAVTFGIGFGAMEAFLLGLAGSGWLSRTK
jgi:uncharacterized membrane protein YhfC